jgi:hypothetical protein
MKIRPIKPGHITNCPWCKAAGHKVQAVWHLTGLNKQACDAHKSQLMGLKCSHDHKYSTHYTEADYQTWLKL